ncbi:hypothetical protein OC846_006348 [Tilletia horrida]|uniref:Uncharacterized protein n=1 Tax=Tilletia horrida TaxID=155126 RepID=A0AAN6GL66_9BASI|nr:hypothetical protein OC846_006348 [Tilletia horrida]KAK0562644.1 hypothetical protein OC861_005206 [Tilletia horrida]
MPTASPQTSAPAIAQAPVVPFNLLGGGALAGLAQTGASGGSKIVTTTASSSSSSQPLQTSSLFDPSHIPSLLPRIEHLVSLLLTASRDPHSLNEPLTPEQREAVKAEYEERARVAREAEQAAKNVRGPNVALGADADGDEQDSYYLFASSSDTLLGSRLHEANTAADGPAARTKSLVPGAGARANNLNDALLGRPTPLQEEIVREAQSLKDAFAAARRAVDQLEGGDMSVEEQAGLIEVLTEYGRQQDEVRKVLIAKSDALLQDTGR